MTLATSTIVAVPMSMVRTRAYDPDRDIRREAYMAELDAWKAVEVPMAALLDDGYSRAFTCEQERGLAAYAAACTRNQCHRVFDSHKDLRRSFASLRA